MPKPAAIVLSIALAGCAAQPLGGDTAPSPDTAVITAPEPDASTRASDILLFVERGRQAAALIISSIFADGFSEDPSP